MDTVGGHHASRHAIATDCSFDGVNCQKAGMKTSHDWREYSKPGNKQAERNMIRFRHYKGGLYELVCEATLESDHTPMVVYRAADGTIWCRPKAVFYELVNVDGQLVPRFAPVN